MRASRYPQCSVSTALRISSLATPYLYQVIPYDVITMNINCLVDARDMTGHASGLDAGPFDIVVNYLSLLGRLRV